MTVAEFRDQAKRPEKATPVRGGPRENPLKHAAVLGPVCVGFEIPILLYFDRDRRQTAPLCVCCDIGLRLAALGH